MHSVHSEYLNIHLLVKEPSGHQVASLSSRRELELLRREGRYEASSGCYNSCFLIGDESFETRQRRLHATAVLSEL